MPNKQSRQLLYIYQYHCFLGAKLQTDPNGRLDFITSQDCFNLTRLRLKKLSPRKFINYQNIFKIEQFGETIIRQVNPSLTGGSKNVFVDLRYDNNAI